MSKIYYKDQNDKWLYDQNGNMLYQDVYDPISISNCVGWYNTTTGNYQEDSGRVSQWTDLTGNNNHFTSIMFGMSQPVLSANTLNGYSSIYCDTTDAYQGLDSNDHTGFTDFTYPCTFIVVGSVNKAVASSFIECGDPGMNYTRFAASQDIIPPITTSRKISNNTGSSIVGTPATYQLGTNYMTTFVIGKNNASIYEKGTVTSVNNSSFSGETFYFSDGIHIGNSGVGSATQLNIVELAIYNKELSSTEVSNLYNNYFKNKYGI